MATASPVPPTSQPGGESAAPQKQRSQGEKVVVWGGIVLLLVLVAVQARARLGYSKTLEALQDRMAEDEGADANPLLVKDLPRYVFGWPSQKEEQRGKHLKTIELTWNGLPMTKPLGLVLACDPEEDGGTVMALESSGFAESDATAGPPSSSKDGAEQVGEKPGAQPAAEPAATTSPAEAVATEPAATSEPAATEPAAPTEPAATEPAPAEQPTAETPAAEAPTTTEPAADKPADK